MSCSGAAQGRGTGSVQRLPLLSSHGPLAFLAILSEAPASATRQARTRRGGTCVPFPASRGPIRCVEVAHAGTAAYVHFLMAEPGWREEGLVPLQYLFCEVC